MIPPQALQCVHEAVKGFVLDPHKHSGDIQNALQEASVRPFFDLVAKAGEPGCAAQCMSEGQERLKLTLGVVKGLCDHALMESRRAKLPDDQFLLQSISALAALQMRC